MYLSTQGEDFEGGDFVFNDPADEKEATVSMEEAKVDQDSYEEDEADDMLAKLLAGEALPDDEVAAGEFADDEEDPGADALLARLLAGEELPDDEDSEEVDTSDLVDNHWADEDPEEYEDIEYFNSLKDTMRRSGRKITPFHPNRGAAVIFSSGWEVRSLTK